MEITVASSSIPDLAHAVYEDASFERQFSLRPYNYYAPETTTWWIIPEKDWPAYHRGKGVFERSHWPIDRVLCGLHIEKGFDRAVASPDTHTNYIMNADWTWHPFITDLRSGVITRTAQSICDTVGCPATIEIDCWALTAFDSTDGRDSRREDDDSEKTPPPDYLGRVGFELESSTLRKIGQDHITELTRRIAASRHLNDLADALAEPQLRWAWVNFIIGVPVALSHDNEAEANMWRDADVWPRLMRPWLPWIK